MTTTLYHYTGTGNSLWTAREIASHLPESRVVAMKNLREGPIPAEGDRLGLVFPVHMWGVPEPILSFLARLQVPDGAYVFAVAVNAGQVSRTLIQLQEVLAKRGIALQAGFSMVLPSNYIPWGGAPPKETQDALFAAARTRIAEVARIVEAREARPVEMGPLWQRVVFTGMYKLTLRQIPTMDKGFWVDEKCSGCGTCVKTCPCGNIELSAGKPTWRSHCEQCLACIQWCPKESIQYGKKTPSYARYHHPDVKLVDMIR